MSFWPSIDYSNYRAYPTYSSFGPKVLPTPEPSILLQDEKIYMHESCENVDPLLFSAKASLQNYFHHQIILPTPRKF